MLSNYNFNLNPYYDDFDETKNFYRILFRPGYAVQARELTQLQTQLQDQISKFGDHIFKDGSVVLGGGFSSGLINYIVIDTVNTDTLNGFQNRNVVGSTSNAKARIISTKNVDDTQSKLYFSYLNGNIFANNEVITTTTEGSTSIFSANTSANSSTYYGPATSFSIDGGVFFVNGHFVYCEPQTIIIAEDGAATCRVGLLTTETIIKSDTDTSLLDPALGSYNYSAPGADRYSITLTLISYAYDPEIDDVNENSSKDFVELARFVDGQQVTVNKLPVYSEIEKTFARRTYDESGDYTVKSFGLRVIDHIYANSQLLSLQVEPGKAYVKGYEFETIAPTYIDLPKSRETNSENGFPLYSNYGKYLLIEDIKGDLDYTANKVLNLRNDTTGSNASIGNCIVKFVDYYGEQAGKSVYKLYIDNINLPFPNTISEIRSVANSSGTLYTANISVNSYSTGVSIEGNDNPAYLIKTGKDYTKTFLINGVSDTSYETILRFQPQQMISNVAVFTNATANQSFIGTGTLSEADTKENFIAVVTTQGIGAYPVGTVLTYDTGLRVTITNESEVIVSCNNTYNAYVSLIAKIAISSAQNKTKTLVSNTELTITGYQNVANIESTISLQKADCYKLNYVKAVSNTGTVVDFTKYYDLYTGQTDTMYDHGYIKLKDGFVSPPKMNLSQNLVSFSVSFDYFNHSGSGFFNVDSYTSSGIDYEEIPKYTASTGEVYDLKNTIDFRARRDDSSANISGTLFMTPSTTSYWDLEYYLGRIDRLVLTKERKLSLIKGIASLTPQVPTDIPDSMGLYIINVPPYTADPKEVSTTFIENKRYTMRDIGRIEKRIERLEYYTALSLLEKQAKDESIPSSNTAVILDRFKNGILVDSFSGHSVGDVSNTDYRCSIDYVNRYLRPSFTSQAYNFTVNSLTNAKRYGDLLLLDYTTETFINQPLSSTWVNLNPYNIFEWNGLIELNPPSDNWIDTQTRPDVVVNLNGENDVYTVLADNVDNPASVGVRWTDWQTVVNGVPQTTSQISTSTTVSNRVVDGKILQDTAITTTDKQTTTTTDSLIRAGLEVSTGSVQTITKDLGSKVVDVSIVPYVRSRIVDFSAKALKPDTDLKATFDDVDITKYCSPATEILVSGTVNQNADSIVLSTDSNITGRIVLSRPDRIFAILRNANTDINAANTTIQTGNTFNWIVGGVPSGSATASLVKNYSSLKTNEQGDIAGSFWIPNTDTIKFRTGEKTFRLADVLGKGASTAAATKYVAQGLSQTNEKTIVATRVATTSINPILDTKEVIERSDRIVVSTNVTTVDVTPPPPPPPKIACNTIVDGRGKKGKFVYTVDFGTETGQTGINYDTFSIPDRYTVIWDGNEYTTGFVGSNRYDSQLQALGFPKTVGPASGQLRFNKTKAFPNEAQIIVDAPLKNTGWKFTSVCPVVEPPVERKLSLDVALPANYTFETAHRNGTAAIFSANVSFSVTVNRSDLAPGEKGTTWNTVVITPVLVDYTGKERATISGSIKINDQLVNPDASGTYTIPYALRTGQKYQLQLTVPSPSTQLISGSGLTTSRYTLTLNSTATEYEEATRTTVTTRTASDTDNISVLFAQNARVLDPVSQTFFVDSAVYPNGLFLDSIDLYFRSKSLSIPVILELRPTVNGYPSSKDIIPFSEVTLLPSEITTSADASVATNFKFRSPVYLPPGEHCFVVKTNTTDYEVYSARIGDSELVNADRRITNQPYVGSMFKSQNASTWTPVQDEDLMFKINKCVFDTTVTGIVTMYSDFTENGDIEYDLFFADSDGILDFADTNIDYFYRTTSSTGVLDGSFTSYQLGSNVPMVSRRVLRTGINSDLQFRTQLTTVDRNISPVIDLSRLKTVLVKNIINNGGLSNTDFVITNVGAGYTSNAIVNITGDCVTPASAYLEYNANTGLQVIVTNPGSGYVGDITATIEGGGATANAQVKVYNELDSYKGNATARYITRRVNLANGFESKDLKVYLLAKIPTSTSIEVYYKVAKVTSTNFEDQAWQKMVIESSGAFAENSFIDYKYMTVNGTACPCGERFKTFAVKIVMYSNDSTKVPEIRDLRVIALDD